MIMNRQNESKSNKDMLTQTLERIGLKNVVAAIFTWMCHVDSITHHSAVFQLKFTTTEIRKINFVLLLQHRT